MPPGAAPPPPGPAGPASGTPAPPPREPAIVLDGLVRRRGERVVLAASSAYGRLVACESSGLVTLYENGVPLAATQNAQQREEAVHYAMCQRPAARRG